MLRADQLRWVGFAGVLLLVVTTLVKGGAPVLAAGIAGMGLLVLAWTLLGRVLTELPDTRWLRWTLVLWGAPLMIAPPLFSGDVHSYLAQGEIAAHGLDPYTFGPAEALGTGSAMTERVSGYWQDTPSPYGPLFSLLQRWIAGVVGENPYAGVIAHRLIELAGLALIVWAVPRLAKAAGVSERVALWLGVLNPLVLWHFVAGVHNDSLMLGLMLAGTAFGLESLRSSRIDWSQMSIGLLLVAAGALVKLPAIVALAVLGTAIARRQGATWGRLALVGAAMVAGMALVSAAVSIGTGFGFGWLRTLGTSGSVNSWMAPTNWFGFLTGGVGSLFGAHITQTMIGVGKIIGYAVIACGVGFVLHRQLKGRLNAVSALGAMLLVVVAFGPVVQPWYILWAAIPLSACLPMGRSRNVLVGFLAVFAVVLPPLSGSPGVLITGYLGSVVIVAASYLALDRLARRTTPEPVATSDRVEL
ncbi:polyprenol phosphomannose-dependent alpha 1,6 mannosyltransferase MptB [Amycolatopsis magusensis]|uniref:polyprenol phosphomannose-dependent alpha 1,6 mannosyltransferase MptB n=1 Tax=Amycolatopsis magusensis TaxID=882444 RepID=UPI0024A8742B|nr:polyprenol phosphomannose-dependent alpha 1,6 mannosyltransferase MptB [Amycolatopsis magusensis]MDI5977351.1 polyprenol phosphomannose-dependent alpha 1,6 mannosyltransferase MptB [Amycolatopsis magusensis]